MFRLGLLFGITTLGLGWLPAVFHTEAVAWAQAVAPGERAAPNRSGDELTEVVIPPGDDRTGYLGIVADDRADRGRGVRVLEVIRDAAAEKGGLKAGDLIVEADGRPIRSMVDLAAVMQPTRPGETKTFVVERDGQKTELRVVLGRRPPPSQRPFPSFGRIEQPQPGGAPSPAQGGGAVPRRGLLGVRAAPVSPATQRRLRLPVTQGALVAGIVTGSPADEAGIPLDAVIVGINGQAVGGPDDLARLVNQAGPGAEIELQYFDRGRLMRRRVRLRSPDASATARPGENPTRGSTVEEIGEPRDAHRLPPPAGEPFSRQPTQPGAPNAFSQQLDQRLQHVEQRLERLEALLERLLQQREDDTRSPREGGSNAADASKPPTK